MRSLLCVLALFVIAVTGRVEALCGDCNLSGAVDIVDALAAAQHAVGLNPLMGAGLANCDVNASGAVDIVDALNVAQASTGLPISLCGGMPPVAGTCGDPIMLTSGVPYMGTTVGGVDADYLGCTSSFTFAGERVHRITFAGTMNLSVQLSPNPAFNSALAVRTICTDRASEIGCTAVAGMQSLSFPGRAGGTYYVIVDGRSNGMAGEGTYTLTVTVN